MRKILKIKRVNAGYCIVCSKGNFDSMFFDLKVANTINISYKDYVSILKKFNPFMYHTCHYFGSKYEAQKVLKYIEDKHLVMQKLIGAI